MNDNECFACFAAVGGLRYQRRPDIDPRKLPGYGAKPRRETYSYPDGQKLVSLMWDTSGGGSTSQSPAAAWASSIRDGHDWPQVLRRTYEALELPGTASDYHFALLAAYQALWKLRRKDPELLPELERLCQLDIGLLEARPRIVVEDERASALRVPAFEFLVHLYEEEGFLDDALSIAQRGKALGQGDQDIARLQARIQDLRAENA
jgi:hypothetical protein